jgi:Fimbrial assembly protein (PilN)
VADVDLIPADYTKAQLVRRRVRQLLLACVSVVVIAGVARFALDLVTSSEKVNIARLEKEGQLSTRSKIEADNFRQQKLLAEKQLAELDELRGGDRLRLLLQAIDAAYSDSIWLDELRFFRRDPVPTGNTKSLPGGERSGIIVVPRQNVPVSGAVAQPAEIEQRVEIIGHATNHTRLAEFMRRLGSQPGIAEVRLLDTGLGSYSNSPVINLTLMLLVDDKVRKPR